MNALGLAAQLSVGWRAGSYRMVVVITDIADPKNPALTPIRNNLLDLNIVPVFISPASSPYYTTAVSSLGFGIANSTLADYSDVYTAAFSSVQAAFASIWTVINSRTDTYGFATGVSSIQSGLVVPANRTTYVDVKYNQAYQLYSPNSFTLNQMGWGTTKITAIGTHSFNY